ncbi:hypothetical protein [Sphingomonas solaris]|uniref:Uncharacterized protein n=1 Tax=Alterirhizorhabdus solaris TaxID=2529389 RepID=A0A558QST9_9SPHN|nr:hypothetical protein [Sphingomonas solaris]TVV70117.1 hypothetical protein FOY91_19865 [Sphingomonas solaris]
MAAVAALLAMAAYDRPLPGAAAGIGLFGAVVLIALPMQVLAPVAAPTPGLVLLGGGLLLLLATLRTRAALPLVAVGAGLLVAQQVATGHLLLLAVGETIAGVAAPFALFTALALAPLLARSLSPRIALAGGAALTALAVSLVLVIRLADPTGPTRPAISQVMHVTDLTTGRFYRATSLFAPDRWTRSMLGPAGEAALLPMYDHAFVAPAGPVAVSAPRIRLFRRLDGKVQLTVAGPPGTREIRVALAASVPFAAARVNGVAAPLLRRPGALDRIGWVGRDVTVSLLLTPAAPGRLVARIALLRDGWPADAPPLPPRPADVMPWYDSDGSILLKTETISW